MSIRNSKIPTSPVHYSIIYFPISEKKVAVQWANDINKMYRLLGAEAEVLEGEDIGELFISGKNKEYVVKGIAYVASKNALLQSPKHKK